MIENNEIKVSICCLVYNHEKYLRKCLDGFIMQKTNFKYEVLIHDDASTDKSASIIREYEKKYPDIIKPIIQTENQHSKGIRISWALQYPIAKGQYIALCEGDDYWDSPNKLQQQYNVLEKNGNCSFSAHRVGYIKEDGSLMKMSLPSCDLKSGILSSQKWIYNICTNGYLFQTSCYFFRKDYIEKALNNLPSFITCAKTGDMPLMLFLAAEGDCAYINKTMSRYRFHSDSSWSKRVGRNQDVSIEMKQSEIEMFKAFDEYTDRKYSKYINYSILYRELRIEFAKNNYKAMFYKKYRTVFNSFSTKRKLLYCTYALFPFVRSIYLKIAYR